MNDDENQDEKHENLIIILTRIDERMRNVEKRLDEGVREVASLRVDIASNYVNHDEFKALIEKVNLHQTILFGTIGLICIAVIGALLALVVQHGS